MSVWRGSWSHSQGKTAVVETDLAVIGRSSQPPVIGEGGTEARSTVVRITERHGPIFVAVEHAQAAGAEHRGEITAIRGEDETNGKTGQVARYTPCHFPRARVEQVDRVVSWPFHRPAGSQDTAIWTYRDRVNLSDFAWPGRHADRFQ